MPRPTTTWGIPGKRQGQLAEALACYQRALQLKPDYAEAHNNLGTALQDQGQIAEALACYQRALQLKPDYAEAHNNLGVALYARRDLAGALASYRQALRLRPDFAEAHWNLATALALTGRLRARLGRVRMALEPEGICPAHVRATGLGRLSAVEQENPVIRRADQGLGDTIQFARYARLLQRRGNTVMLECQQSLVPLLTSCPGVAGLCGRQRGLAGLRPPRTVTQPAAAARDLSVHGARRGSLPLCGSGRRRALAPRSLVRCAISRSALPGRATPSTTTIASVPWHRLFSRPWRG